MTALEWYYQRTVIEGKTNYFKLFEEASMIEYKQMMDALQRGMELQSKENNRVGFRERNGLVSSQTEISDEEIEKGAYRYDENQVLSDYRNSSTYGDFIQGAKWYREQLKKKQNGTI